MSASLGLPSSKIIEWVLRHFKKPGPSPEELDKNNITTITYSDGSVVKKSVVGVFSAADL